MKVYMMFMARDGYTEFKETKAFPRLQQTVQLDRSLTVTAAYIGRVPAFV